LLYAQSCPFPPLSPSLILNFLFIPGVAFGWRFPRTDHLFLPCFCRCSPADLGVNCGSLPFLTGEVFALYAFLGPSRLRWRLKFPWCMVPVKFSATPSQSCLFPSGAPRCFFGLCARVLLPSRGGLCWSTICLRFEGFRKCGGPLTFRWRVLGIPVMVFSAEGFLLAFLLGNPLPLVPPLRGPGLYQGYG